jgi:threonylcarbamoyladenosine tRNA methylthiotransferase MtaB
VPDFNITTDIIVGFPGETEDDWQQTLAFVEAMRFGHVHIFAYSPREGTKAAGMPGPVDRDTQRRRSEELHRLAAASRAAVLQRALGRRLDMLVENRTDDDTAWLGYSRDYLRVEIPAARGSELSNRVVPVIATAVSADGTRLLGRLADAAPMPPC